MPDQLPDLPGLYSAVDSTRNVMAFSSRDWAESADTAWLWGIFFGWDPDEEDGPGEDAMREVAARHSWGPAAVERLRALHAAVQTLTISSVAAALPPKIGEVRDAG